MQSIDPPVQIVGLPEPILSDTAIEILNKRYLIKDDEGKVTETPKDMFWRVAYNVAKVDQEIKADEEQVVELARSFYYIMSQGYWLPNSPTLMNAGRPLGQLSACFVLPVEDSLTNGKDGIYDTLTNMAKIHQSGGGTGFSFNSLRPGGSTVKSTTGVASGPVSFMSLYDASTDVVKQGGTRRGANMGILRVDHPDILDFIDCKKDTSQITNFNISIAITGKFMDALGGDGEESEDYDLVWGGRVHGSLNAGKVWEKIVNNAWTTGEPGLFFVDEANYYNPVPHLGAYEATNPCGEQPLLPYGVCNLGSINLGKFVESDPIITESGIEVQSIESQTISWDRMQWVTDLSMRFLDNVIELNQFPLQEISDRAQSIRRIGNGVMGFADMLVKLGIPYGSDLSFDIAEMVSERFVGYCKEASEELADDRGAFPEWPLSIHGPDESCARDSDGERVSEMRLQRHCNVTTVAPTGTISIIAGCSSGIEPLYAVAFERNQAGARFVDVNEDFKAGLEAFEPELDVDKTIEAVLTEGSVQIPAVPARFQTLYQTSATVTPHQHVNMQSTWQRNICSGISKTINLPEVATVDSVGVAFRQAYGEGCKGVTVYRDGSRPFQVLSTGKTKGAIDGDGRVGTPSVVHAREDRTSLSRPERLDGSTHKIVSPVGEMFVTVNKSESGDPYEVFVAIGKAGGTANSFGEACGRLISLALRSGIPVKQVYKQLKGISSDRAVGLGQNKILSGPDAVAVVLKSYMKNGEEKAAESDDENGHQFGGCPDCGADLVFAEGCYKCVACGHNGCS